MNSRDARGGGIGAGPMQPAAHAHAAPLALSQDRRMEMARTWSKADGWRV
jgi:hypothetical protein